MEVQIAGRSANVILSLSKVHTMRYNQPGMASILLYTGELPHGRGIGAEERGRAFYYNFGSYSGASTKNGRCIARRPQMPVTSTLLDQAHNATDRK